jgi:hypothetical protein
MAAAAAAAPYVPDVLGSITLNGIDFPFVEQECGCCFGNEVVDVYTMKDKHTHIPAVWDNQGCMIVKGQVAFRGENPKPAKFAVSLTRKDLMLEFGSYRSVEIHTRFYGNVLLNKLVPFSASRTKERRVTFCIWYHPITDTLRPSSPTRVSYT